METVRVTPEQYAEILGSFGAAFAEGLDGWSYGSTLHYQCGMGDVLMAAGYAATVRLCPGLSGFGAD